MNIILASSSPRRTEILNLAKIKHQIIPSTCEEKIDPTLIPIEVVLSLAKMKALDVAKDHYNELVIGADTIVSIDNLILGKPKNELDAIRMLKLLSGRTHQVITGVAIIYQNQVEVFHEITSVTFSKLSEEEILNYIKEENVYDKAGSYAIQGIFCKYITKIDGDYYNVMGLPIAKLYQKLKEYTNEI